MSARRSWFWIAASVAAASCVFPTDMGTCRERFKYCPGDIVDAGTEASAAGAGQGGSDSGSAGRSGSNGDGGVSGSNAGTSAGGAAGSSAGNSAQGGALPCNGTCKGTKPVCDANLNSCVECSNDLDCKISGKPFCNSSNVCVECRAHSDCKDLTASRCDAGTCKPCTESNQCQHHESASVCGSGECVQCTGREYATCGKDAATQAQRVCDSLKQTCTTQKEHERGLCEPCVSDAHCSAGQLCIQQKFGSAGVVGYFCHWEKGDVANGAPSSCFTSGRPYAGTLEKIQSIDGKTADVCTLRTSSCVARNQFSSQDCKTGSSADDLRCGFAPGKDSKCVAADTDTFRCSMTCASNDDCPIPFACNTGAAQPYCKLQ